MRRTLSRIVAALIIGALVEACTEQGASPETPAAVEPEWERVGVQGQMQFVVVSQAREADRSIYDLAIAGLCEPRKWCGIQFWSDRSAVPTSLPMSEAAAKAQTASYIHNPNSGHAQFLWACRINSEPTDCFSND